MESYISLMATSQHISYFRHFALGNSPFSVVFSTFSKHFVPKNDSIAMTPKARMLMSLLICFLTKFQLTSTVTGPDITLPVYNAKHKHVVMIYVIGKDRDTGRVQKSWCTASAIQFGGKLFLLTAAQCVYDHFVQFDCAARCLCVLAGKLDILCKFSSYSDFIFDDFMFF